jgi:hypothetical protein
MHMNPWHKQALFEAYAKRTEKPITNINFCAASIRREDDGRVRCQSSEMSICANRAQVETEHDKSRQLRLSADKVAAHHYHDRQCYLNANGEAHNGS